MKQNKVFTIALFLSIGTHAFVLGPFLNFSSQNHKINNTTINVTYYADTEKEALLSEKPIPIKKIKVSLEKSLPKNTETLRKEKIPEQEILEPPKKTDAIGLKDEPGKQRRDIKKRAIATKVMAFSGGRSDSLNYLSAVRNRINAYIHKHYGSSMGTGEAHIHFELNADGSLVSASIERDNFGDNKTLRVLCLDAIRFASPFEPFPKAINLPQAAFNITISFKKNLSG